jgi:hypothetical protein
MEVRAETISWTLGRRWKIPGPEAVATGLVILDSPPDGA